MKQGPCLEHCYSKQTLHILIVILVSILIGIIIGINLGILIKKHGVYFDFSVQAKEKNNY